MSPTEAMVLLSVAAAFDNRKPDAEAARVWGVALGDLPILDCRDAIVEHYSRTTDWLMPWHVIAIVRRVRAARIAAAGDLIPPDFSHLDDELEEGKAIRDWLAAARKAIGDGEEIPDNGRGQLVQRNMAELLPRPQEG